MELAAAIALILVGSLVARWLGLKAGTAVRMRRAAKRAERR